MTAVEVASAGSSTARPVYLAIEGVIGVGKTTLARLLQPAFRSALVLEAFDRNPFLTGFYRDRTRYAFQTQMFFLLSRYRQGQTVSELLDQRPVIADYIFGKDSLFAHLNLAGDELELYERLYDALAEQMPAPDLVIYLRANTDVLMTRIAVRDRSYERAMDRSYIEDLRQAYERLFSRYSAAPLLVVNANELDFVRDAAALEFIQAQVRARLRHGQYQQMLPEMETSELPLAPVRPDSRDEGKVSPQTAVGAYLEATAAMGRLGSLLAGLAELYQVDVLRDEVDEVIQELGIHLRRLAQAVGSDIWEERRWMR
jgi:deoxyguanosine kinase